MRKRNPVPPAWEARRRAIGRRLQSARVRAGVPLSQVAKEVQTSQLRLEMIEAGVRPMPVEILAEIAAIYGTTVGHLLGERKPKQDAPEADPPTVAHDDQPAA